MILIPCLSILCSLIGAAIGQSKGRALAGAAWGLFAGPIGCLVIAIAPDVRVKCPECGGEVTREARRCKNCGSILLTANPEQKSKTIEEKRNEKIEEEKERFIDQEIPEERAGFFLAAGKLLMRNYKVSTKKDLRAPYHLVVKNPKTQKTFEVNIKTSSQKKVPFLKEKIDSKKIYVFVLLNPDENREEFYLVKGSELLGNLYYDSSEESGTFYYEPIKKHMNKWEIFDC